MCLITIFFSLIDFTEDCLAIWLDAYQFLVKKLYGILDFVSIILSLVNDNL